MKEFYNRNDDFKRYVDRYCKQYGFSIEEAIEHELVKHVAEQYREKEEARIK